MNKKKFLMIGVLIVFIGIIVFATININKKATQTADNNKNADTENVMEITDNYFIEQTNDIFYNTDDYIDKTIKIAGLIYNYEDYNSGETYYAVVRNTPGCCGNDGLAGLDIRYDGEYPEENTWVEIVGTIKTDVVAGEEIPAIKVTSIQETEEGTTFVTN